MTWLHLALAGGRALFVGLIAYLAVTQFLDSAAAGTLRQLWTQYLSRLPFGPVTIFLTANTGLVIALALLAAPLASAIFGQGPRAIVWLLVAGFVLMAPAAISTSWIDWSRFLGEDAARRLYSPDSPATGSLAAVLGVTGALFLIWRIDHLQTELARLRALEVDRGDVVGYVGSQLAATIGVAIGSLALAGVVYLIASGVMLVTGSLEPRSWLSIGAVMAALCAVTLTITLVTVGRRVNY